VSVKPYIIPVNGRVMACLDASVYTDPVVDHAAWAARRLSAGLTFLHVLDRKPAHPPEADFSGNIGMDTQAELLAELVELDARNSKIAIRQGRELLNHARVRAEQAGVTEPDAIQRHGTLADTLTEMEAQVRLFVIGKRGEAADFNSGHLGANLERVVRSVHRPLLVASRQFKPVERFAIAFDGSPTTRKCVEMVAMSPLLKGLSCLLIFAGKETADNRKALDWARELLKGADFEPDEAVVPCDAEKVITDQVSNNNIDLLVMGAYGHSRIRHLIVGSTTTAILRNCHIPVLLLR
jgi:nucleotide-binding universal stress UspA family protein